MLRDEIRKGFTKAKFNEGYTKLIPYEVLFFSIFIGIYFSSWWAFLIGFFGALICIQVHILAEIIICILSLPFAFLFWTIGLLIGGLPAGILFGLVSYFSIVYAHFTSLQYNRDIYDAS